MCQAAKTPVEPLLARVHARLLAHPESFDEVAASWDITQASPLPLSSLFAFLSDVMRELKLAFEALDSEACLLIRGLCVYIFRLDTLGSGAAWLTSR